MTISFIRIDDRIIHGQVVTRWARERKCDGILAVDDKTANDKILSMVVKNAAPPGIKAGIYTVEDAVSILESATKSKKHYFLIVKTPVTLQSLIEKGLSFKNEINVGPLSNRPDTVTVGANASVTKEEILAFESLHQAGYEIQFQLVPNGKAYTWKSVRDKLR